MSVEESRQASAPLPRGESFLSRFFSRKKKNRRLSVHQPDAVRSPAGSSRSQGEMLKKLKAAAESPAVQKRPSLEQRDFHPSAPLLVPLIKSLPFGPQGSLAIGDNAQFNRALDNSLEMIRSQAALYESGQGLADGCELAALLAAGADILKGLSCFEEAKQLLGEAVAVRRKITNANEPQAPLALCLNDYGVLLLDLQQYDAAIEILHEARDLFSLNDDSLSNECVAATFGNEAIAHRYLRNFSGATAAHETALKMFRDASGSNSEDFLYQKGQLGITLAVAGDNLMAKKVLAEVVSSLPEDHIYAVSFRYELTHLSPNN